MTLAPLQNFIERREFDKYQSGLISRFKAYRFKYELTYGELTGKSAMFLSFVSVKQIGKVAIYGSGECNLDVFDKASGECVLHESHLIKSEQEFLDIYKAVPIFMRKTIKDN